MEAKATKKESAIGEKAEVLIAIGAATAANCIPCFEHLYEKAVTSGATSAEIRRAFEIAGQVKSGAHAAICGTVEELAGSKEKPGPAVVSAPSGCVCR